MSTVLDKLFYKAKKYHEDNNYDGFMYNDYFAYKYDSVPQYDRTVKGLQKYFRGIFSAYSYASPRLLDYINPKIIQSIRETVDPIIPTDASKNMSAKLIIDKYGEELISNILDGMLDEINEQYYFGFDKEEVLAAMKIVVESDNEFMKNTGIGRRIVQPFLMEALVLKNFKNVIAKYAMPFNIRFANYNEDKMMGVDIVIEHMASGLPLSPLYLQVKPRYQAEWAFNNSDFENYSIAELDFDQKGDSYWKQKIAQTLLSQNQRADHVLWVGYDFGNNATKVNRTLWVNGTELEFAFKGKTESFAVGYNVDQKATLFLKELIKDQFLLASGYDIVTETYHREKDKKKELLSNLENAQRSDKSDLKAATIYGQKQIDNLFKKDSRSVSKKREPVVINVPALVLNNDTDAKTVAIDLLDGLYNEQQNAAKELTKTRKEVPPEVLYDDHYADMPTRSSW